MKFLNLKSAKLVLFASFFVVSAAVNAFGATFNGTLSTSDPVFNRPVNCTTLSGVGTAVPYKTFSFTVLIPQTMIISLSATDGAIFTAPSNAATIDTFLILYGPGGFNPASPLANCVALNDDANGTLDRRSRIVTGILPTGTYTYVVASFDNVPSGPSVLPWAYTGFITDLQVPTAAGVKVGGQVVSADGRGVYRASVAMTDANGATRTAITNNFGYFTFEDVRAGESYFFNITHKQYTFAPRVLNVTDNIVDLDFIASP